MPSDPIPGDLPYLERGYSIWREFKRFAFKGNVMDLAIGVVIGSAFSKVVDGLVTFIIMPVISIITPKQGNWDDLDVTVAGSTIEYGQFLATVINFLLISGLIFLLVVKLSQWLFRESQKEKANPSPPVNKQEQLLTDIRDLLRANFDQVAGVRRQIEQTNDEPPPT